MVEVAVMATIQTLIIPMTKSISIHLIRLVVIYFTYHDFIFKRSELVKQYNILYEKTRVETLEALNDLQELKKAQILKSKILFSIIVVGFGKKNFEK